MKAENSLIKINIDASKFSFHMLDSKDLNFSLEYSKDEVIDIYGIAYTIRLFELECEKFFNNKQIRGFCHLVIGQENIYAALKKVMHTDDYSISSYRCHGLAYITGSTISEIVGEMLGKAGGNSKGMGGSMHLYNKNFFGGHGIVGAQIPLGLGLAFSQKYKEIANTSFPSESNEKAAHEHSKSNANQSIYNNFPLKNVTFCFYGDGASNQGQIYESFNMAHLWKLPVVFICENNKYGMWTAVDKASADNNFYKRSNYIPGIRIDHSNTFEIIEVLKFARDYALKSGPIIVEIDCYRLCGHSLRDKNELRNINEVEEEKAKDPLILLRKNIMEFKPEEYILKIEEQLKNIVFNEIKNAENMCKPNPEMLYENILSK
ncbi:subunit alpha of pyruvate dehydrogenase E1 [Hamiltosporidium tvaerminnensis]|uniref:Subunit alpha of pyruvate dehydrogenase E1 n=3 Tax=Hamiltosporidium TaxID=1176354 RepID=A0A4Q9LY63_9MICR|nr:alpha subunit of pyruvate dehydrogenase [Hamiltosporidium tvaerminnensis]TBU02129.1 subunit alpha of pyruvate dehydrogenase E1 [Hamiltosporidium tvaerminnensis]TBU08991.1 subunit alpha of pyruvate dehydrogenase E1 [Hamiltosporidium magnivora]TBU13326.1 subunit alpha of pyruvate dehydrogenase E1 [Hamiltosporidium tvaerminnensis]